MVTKVGLEHFRFFHWQYDIHMGVVVVMIVWQLDSQLPVQSLPIATKVVSSNSAQAMCTQYNIM